MLLISTQTLLACVCLHTVLDLLCPLLRNSAIGDQPLEASSGEKAFAIVKEGSHGQRRTLNEMEKEILLRANQYLKGKL